MHRLVLGADLFFHDDVNHLIVVDYFSKWIEVAALAAQTTDAVTSAMEQIFGRLGGSETLRSDNGPCFASESFRAFSRKWGFHHRTSSPRYPQSNGQVERAVGIVKRLWRGNCNKTSALLAYRTTPLKDGPSPADLMYGRPLLGPLGKTYVMLG